jgi:peptide/nickel transport system substrate-binding protein
LVCNENPYKKSVAEALQKSLATLGIKATISLKNKTDYIKALEAGYYEIYIGEIELPADGDLTEFFVADGQVNFGIAEKTSVLYNNFKNGDVNMTEFIEGFNLQVPFAPLFYRKTVMSVNPDISGITKSEGDVYLSASDWRVKK